MPESSDLPGHILVVDDLEANRQLLGDCLSAAGHACRLAASAHEALAIIDAWPPDVILLDIMMPNVNGLELCKQLKSRADLVAVPIILITAMQERATRIKGIEAGANDFLLKPVDTHEVFLRIRNALRTKRLYDQIKDAHERLRQLEALRDSMTHMLVHDLRSPLQGISMCLETIVDCAQKSEVADIASDAGECMRTTRTLTEMVSTILDVSRLEAQAMPVDPRPETLRAIIMGGVDRVYHQGLAEISVEVPELTVVWDVNLISRAVANLVANALKYAPGESIRISAQTTPGEVELRIDDHGPGVPSAHSERLFTKFGSLSTDQRHSTGVGLFFCKQVAEAHGGSIGVIPLSPSGSRFWMRIPMNAPGSTIAHAAP